MIRVTVKAKTMDDKNLKLWGWFSEIDGPVPMDEALKVVGMFRKHVSNVVKVRIDIELHADCRCIQDNRPTQGGNRLTMTPPPPNPLDDKVYNPNEERENT